MQVYGVYLAVLTNPTLGRKFLANKNNQVKPLDKIEITTGESQEYTVIWLHGLGASGHDFEPLVPELGLLSRPGVRFLFPHAPVRPITINGGAAMRGWYDITSLDFEQREQDVDGTMESAQLIIDLIEAEISRGIDSRNILLAGFSQGGAIALYTALTYDKPLAGILALSTYLPLADRVMDTLSDANKNIPVFMAHGRSDETIRLEYAESSRTALENSGIAVEWHTYAMAHSVSAEEVSDISIWLKKLLGM